MPVSRLISDGLLAINDGYRAKNSELSSSGLPFARAGNIDGGFRFQSADRFPAVNLANVGEKVSRPGDVVFTSKGTVGRFAFVGSDTETFVYSPQLCFWRSMDHERLLPRWLFYWMQSGDFRQQYLAVAGQTDMAAYVNLRDQRRMHMHVPPPSTQRAIAHILGTLDDKIDLDRRMAETLEAIARAIFKSWFVDFDPVRAKAEGRDTGLPKEVADLFPDRLVESEIGEVPEGWDVSPVDSVAQVIYGAPFASSNFNGEQRGLPLIRIRDLATQCPGVFTDEIHPKGYLVQPGDTIVGMDGEFRARTWSGSPAWLNQRVCVFSPVNGATNAFVKHSIAPLLAFEEAIASGTTVIHLGKKDIVRWRISHPGVRLLREHGRLCQPLLDRSVACHQQSHTLAALRDTLLPKLISGELRVPDAMLQVEEATA